MLIWFGSLSVIAFALLLGTVMPVQLSYAKMVFPQDIDNDGLTIAEEAIAGTNPGDPDTDGDYYLDGFDLEPLVPNFTPDTDHDGIDDEDELAGCWLDARVPCLDTDSDGDDWNDEQEILLGSDPFDKDRIPESPVVIFHDWDNDTISDSDEPRECWGDVLTTCEFRDVDGDTYSDREEIFAGTNQTNFNDHPESHVIITAEADLDKDGTPDVEETSGCWLNSSPDCDGVDTDGDGWTDREEEIQGSDPLDSSKHPESHFVIPESPIGGIAMIASSIAALGIFYGWRRQKMSRTFQS